jgi:hypothetical protein
VLSVTPAEKRLAAIRRQRELDERREPVNVRPLTEFGGRVAPRPTLHQYASSARLRAW